jgi:mevalonate kinase
MWSRFYSHGKLLLTGEYTVLDGSLSLALPTRFGQSLKVRQGQSPVLKWSSFDENGELWFEQQFNQGLLEQFPVNEESLNSEPVAKRLISILSRARELNPDFLSTGSGFDVETHMDFSRQWGLGTSSTLINNIAQWANVDPYELQRSTFGGSGYDIACAIHGCPLLYQLENDQPKVNEVVFDPIFKEHLHFVYLNRKQDSRQAIERYNSIAAEKSKLIAAVSSISRQVIDCNRLNEFQALMSEHETLLAKTLQLETVQDLLFPDFKGVVKSLGAWGGDFVLAASDQHGPEYFSSKGYKTIVPYSHMLD